MATDGDDRSERSCVMTRIVRMSMLLCAVAVLTALPPLANAQNRPRTCNRWSFSWVSTSGAYCSASGAADCGGGTCPGESQYSPGSGVCACYCCADVQ